MVIVFVNVNTYEVCYIYTEVHTMIERFQGPIDRPIRPIVTSTRSNMEEAIIYHSLISCHGLIQHDPAGGAIASVVGSFSASFPKS
jgi:hypothetical protein